MPDRQVVLAERYRDALIDVRRRVSARVAANWAGLGAWNEADVPRFLNATLPVVAAGQRRTVSLTDAYLARVTSARTVGLPVDDLIGAAVRNGADPADVYRRPFVQLWSALADGRQFTDALSAAGARVEATAATDVTLTMRASADSFSELTEGPKITRWVRVTDPDACEFCVLISDRIYKTADLMPVHDRCNCSVAPADDAVSEAFNAPQVARVSALESVPEVAVHHHGELGAVLSDSSHSFSGPASVAA